LGRLDDVISCYEFPFFHQHTGKSLKSSFIGLVKLNPHIACLDEFPYLGKPPPLTPSYKRSTNRILGVHAALL
jgi:hypothetical protein